jgi:DNA-binding NarL/FixJ family response regulator
MKPSSTMNLGVVAPFWLHEPLGVMLQAAPGVTWTGCATTVEALLSAPVEEPRDLVLLYASDRHVASQIKKVKAAWPKARCIVLVERTQLQEIAQQAGADLVLLEGLVPGRLIKTLDSFLKSVGHDPS